MAEKSEKTKIKPKAKAKTKKKGVKSVKKTSAAEKRPRGRPKIEIDLEMVQDLVSVGCTQSEIANLCGFCDDLFNTREDLIGAYKKGMDNFRASLRRQQWMQARSGDTGMLIWLGKQYLGQGEPKNKTEIDMSVKNADGFEVIIDGKPEAED